MFQKIEDAAADILAQMKARQEPDAWVHYFRRIKGHGGYSFASLSETVAMDTGFEHVEKRPAYFAPPSDQSDEIKRLRDILSRQAESFRQLERAREIEVSALREQVRVLTDAAQKIIRNMSGQHADRCLEYLCAALTTVTK